MKEKKLVLLFDYDGTIVDSLNEVFKAFNRIAPEYGIEIIEDIEKFIQLYDNNVYDSIALLGLPRKKVEDFVSKWREPFLLDNVKVHVFKGMEEALAILAKKAELYVITSNATDAIKKSIKRFGLHGIKEVIGGDIEPSKTTKIKKLKEQNKGYNIYYIGDTLGDMVEARKAGVKTIGVTWGVHSREKLKEAKPDYIVDTPEELVKVLMKPVK